MKTSIKFYAALAPLALCGDALAVTRMPLRAPASAMMSAPVRAPEEAQVKIALDGARLKYGLDNDHGYRLTARHPGGPGAWVTRYAHTYKGLRILGSESVIVSDAGGKVVGETLQDLRSGLGQGAGSSLLAGSFIQFDVTPRVAAADAVRTAQGVAPLRVVAEAAPASAELLIYPVQQRMRAASVLGKRSGGLNAADVVKQLTGYELAYLVKTREMGVDRPLFRDTLVSARDGHVIAQWNAVQTVAGVGYSQYNGQVRLSTAYTNGSYWMQDPLRGTGGKFGVNTVVDAAHTGTAGDVYMRTFNSWGDGQDYQLGWPTLGENGQTAAVNAMWGMMNTYDTLKNVLGWSSLDGNNTATYIAVHAWDGYDNAYYSDACHCMFIGDGGARFYNLGAIDIIGHEMGHGVTAATAALDYHFESGGLNESASDINGEMTEAYANAGAGGATIPARGNDWLIGQQVSRSGAPLRWMIKPSKDGASPNAWSWQLQNLDVHYSSGPNNRMFYFLSQGSSADPASDAFSPYLNKWPRAMTGIGNDKAYRIWFRALTTKFTSTTDYMDARNKLYASAIELYGPGPESAAVLRAYAAVNVGKDLDEPNAGQAFGIVWQPQPVTAPAGTTAWFAVAPGGGTPPYAYQWRRNGVSVPGATGSVFGVVAQPGDNGALYSVLLSDARGQSVASDPAQLTVTAGGPAELVFNGGFEAGWEGWRGNTAVVGSWQGAGEAPYEGKAFAYMGGNGRAATETLGQPISIPAGAASASLSFALHVDTAEIAPATAYDTLAVEVKNAAGTVLATLATYSNLDARPGYQVRSFDLSAFRGQDIVLSFTMNEDYALQTGFCIDKVSVAIR
ncbi:M4 family metallopeptidase [Massilia terrae]|uniref:M4 family metallopeptidase n=1 Tax=Massilia terrae TaxID=1811224 RepID=A0ABT2D1G4_9BURK|nr:M4 family metallopeptidase [Massilia terrae]MCS0659875.1 M4 family metallopeptidase [Massilia terrae]